MKVALLGAPGAGKTRFANKLASRLNEQNDFRTPWKTIDGYVPKLAKRVGHPFGPIFNRLAFPCQVQVVAERWTLEDEALRRGYNTITCGTIYESVIYASAQAIPIPYLGDERMIVEESLIATRMVESLSMLSDIRFDYDCMFYLPAAKVEPDTWDAVVDAKVLDVLEGKNLQAMELRDTPKKNFEHAIFAITAIADTIASNEQQAARGDDLSGSRHEPGSEPMPDVSAEEN